jgi:CheY-like chemotaxis protein
VVLAEDDALVREMAAELLLDLGHEVVEADTGDAALRAVRAGADLLITDLDLPDCDGLWLAARANEAIPDLAVIVASGHQPDPGNCLAWLQKPYDSEALRQAIDRVVPWPLASPT